MDEGSDLIPDDAVVIAGEEVSWLGGTMRLRVDAYLTRALRDSAYVTSARAVLITDAGCALLRNRDGLHVLPGGRRQGQETLIDALSREVREEVGCRIVAARPLGFLHFRHLTPKPTDYPYPYPVFLHAVFAVRGSSDPEFHGDPDGYEDALEFVAPADLDRFNIPTYQRLLVRAAVSQLA